MASILSLCGTIFIDNTKANKSIDTTTDKAEKSGSKVGKAFSNIAKGAVAVGSAVVAGAAAIGTAAYKMATDASEVQTSFAKVKTLLSGTNEEAQAIFNDIKKASIETGVSVTDFSESVYGAISASVDQAHAVEFTTNAIKLAKGGFTETATAVDVLTTAINAYGLSADDATSISDTLIMTQNLGKTTVDELASSMGKTIPVANAANVQLNDLSTQYAVMTKNGVATAEAGTQIKAMLGELSKTGSTTDKALRELTGKSFAELQGEGKNTAEILNMLSGYAEQNGITLKDMFGSVQAGSAALTLVKDGGEDFNNILDEMANAAGATEKAYETMSNTLEEKIGKVKNAAKVLYNNIGEAVIPIVEKFADLIMDKMPQIQSVVDRLIPIISNIFETALPPLFELIETVLPIMFDLLETLITPLSDIISAILPVIISLISQIMPIFVEIVKQVLPTFVEILDIIMPEITGILDNVLPLIIQLLQTLLPPLLQIIEEIFPAVISLIDLFSIYAEEIITAILPVIINLLDSGIIPVLMELIQSVLYVLADLFDLIQYPLDLIIELLPLLLNLIESFMPILLELIQAVLPVIVNLIELITPILSPIMLLLYAILSPLIDLLKVILPPLISLFTSLINKALAPLKTALSFVAEILGTVFKNAFWSIGDIILNIKGYFQGIIDFVKNVFTGNWRGAWQSVLTIFKNIFEGIKNAVKLPINWIIDSLNVFIRGLNKIKIPDWVPGVGGMGLNIKELSRLRIGMEYVPYDEYPALLHKGERVLTAGENKEYSKSMSAENTDGDNKLAVYITLGERAVYIENLNGQSGEDIDGFVELLLELIAEKIKRKGLVFG